MHIQGKTHGDDGKLVTRLHVHRRDHIEIETFVGCYRWMEGSRCYDVQSSSKGAGARDSKISK